MDKSFRSCIVERVLLNCIVAPAVEAAHRAL
jgi:hypothetical protein